MKRVNFFWNEDNTKVVIQEDINGKWYVNDLSSLVKENDQNLYRIGIDPYQPKIKWYQRLLRFFGIFKR